MEAFDRMLDFNRRWAAEMVAKDRGYFTRQVAGQTPQTLFIGCSDARVETSTMMGTAPGELFVHRNIANQVYGSDLNVLATVDYAVDVLDVKHIIVCGHYGCSGVRAAAAAESPSHGLTDHWLSQLRTIKRLHKDELDACGEGEARLDRLAELNVLEQLHNLAATPVIRDAWARGRRPILHAVVYDIRTGLLKELAPRIDGVDRIPRILGSAG